MPPTFAPAVKEQSKLRLSLYGPAGGGKTLTSMLLGVALAGVPDKLGVIDSEHGSAAKYADQIGAFGHLVMERYAPDDYSDAIRQALEAKYLATVIDSFSHAWEGEGGILELQSVLTEQNRGDSMTGWNKVRPHEKKLWNTVLSANTHLIVTMRSRNQWVEGTNDQGRKTRDIVGLEPVQRKGSEYEFDVVCFMEPADEGSGVNLKVEKSRYDQLPRGATWHFDKKQPEAFTEFTEAVLASVRAGEPPEAATKAEIRLMTELLTAEGYEEKRINDVLEGEKAAWGVIPKKFVRKQTELAIARAEKKRADEQPQPEPEAEPEPATA